jgi:hypothetical protein
MLTAVTMNVCESTTATAPKDLLAMALSNANQFHHLAMSEIIADFTLHALQITSKQINCIINLNSKFLLFCSELHLTNVLATTVTLEMDSSAHSNATATTSQNFAITMQTVSRHQTDGNVLAIKVGKFFYFLSKFGKVKRWNRKKD